MHLVSSRCNNQRLLTRPQMRRSEVTIPEVSFRAEAGGFSSPNGLAYEFGFVVSEEQVDSIELQVRWDQGCIRCLERDSTDLGIHAPNSIPHRCRDEVLDPNHSLSMISSTFEGSSVQCWMYLQEGVAPQPCVLYGVQEA